MSSLPPSTKRNIATAHSQPPRHPIKTKRRVPPFDYKAFDKPLRDGKLYCVVWSDFLNYF
jgi:hypothetical protein